MTDWFRLEKEAALRALNTSADGLSGEEARRRLEQYGRNELVDRGTKSPWKILLEQFTGVMVVILLIAALISVALHEVTDAVVIMVIVVLNAGLGFSQEYRAEKAMAALKQMAVPHVRARRDGRLQEIPAQDLVPGDVVLLEAGNAIPADGRLLDSVNLRIQEAVLTGESEPVEKHTRAIGGEHVSLGDRRNMAYMGTAVTYGRGALLITGTGMKTELGRIAEMIQSVGQQSTPLQKRLEQLGRGLAVAALIIVAIVFGMGLLRGEPLRLMVLTAISMAVAAVPEGLPAVVTIALALGAQRMLSRHALIRKLPAVETLGSVTVICSDKTGTLTQNRMTVTVVDVAGNHVDFQEEMQGYSPTVSPQEQAHPLAQENCAVTLLLVTGALCNDAILEPAAGEQGGFSAVGDPTEGALVIAAARAGLWKSDLEKALPRVAELPFDSDRKRMTTVHRVERDQLPAQLQTVWQSCGETLSSGPVSFTKGAVDGLLEISTRVWVDGRLETMTSEWRRRIEISNARMAGDGMRVLGAAFRLDPGLDPVDPSARETDLIFIGLVGMIDPARPEVKQAVQTALSAGIRPVMITGDHPLTAGFIARELGIAGPGSRVLTGQELAQMDVAQLEALVEEVPVYARVSPENKLMIVTALKNRGHNVAMTGDGVNDAPALKKADIGIAMGITGTDVSKEASDMVLLDDNFATIVAAVEEGRRIYENIRKFIKYALTSNAGEIWVMLLAPFFGMQLPLTPLQILWINLVTDGVPGLALSVEPADRNTMRRPPHPPAENIFGRGMGRDVLWIGLLLGLVSLLSGYLFFRAGNPDWQTILFTTLTLAQMGNALATRTETDSLFRVGLLSNKPMLGAVLLTLALQLAVIYVPFLQNIFRTQPLTLAELALSLLLSTIVFWAIELVKVFRRAA